MVNSILHITTAVAVASSELHFRTSRSSGPGGQNVNKVETRVELLFDVARSPSLNDEQKGLITAKLGTRVDADGVLHLSSQQSRSQWENKQLVIEKFVRVLRAALKVKRKRIKTSPTESSKQRRVQQKKMHGRKKKLRKVHDSDE